jgi:hypothetical protein
MSQLGLSSAKVPQIGPRVVTSANGAQIQNQCHFLKISDDTNPMDDGSPTGPTTTSKDFHRESEPASAASANGRNEGFGDQPNWMPIDSQLSTDQGQDVHSNLQGLASISIATAGYSRSHEMNNSSGYGNSESSTTGDTSLSPDTGNSASNRPTPNASTPSDTRPSLQPGQNSGRTSYETSPASSNQRLPATDGRSMSSFFSTQPDYSNITATGLTPDNTFTMPETPGRSFDVPSGWEMSNQTTGLTPVGEGVFRTLMGLGPMDPM